jgi:dCMP deaminase
MPHLTVCSSRSALTLENFVREDDCAVYGASAGLPDRQKANHSSLLHLTRDVVHLRIINSFESTSSLNAYLESLDLLNMDRLRPTWDTYFMVCFCHVWAHSFPAQQF